MQRFFFIVLTSLLFSSSLLQARVINIDALAFNAATNNKHLMLFLHKTGCGYCENMKAFTLEDEKVKQKIKHNFFYEHLNVYTKDSVIWHSKKYKAKEFAIKTGYDFYPTTLFFDKNGNIIFAEVGYRDNQTMPNEKRFLSILEFIDSKSYTTKEYEEYLFSKE